MQGPTNAVTVTMSFVRVLADPIISLYYTGQAKYPGSTTSFATDKYKSRCCTSTLSEGLILNHYGGACGPNFPASNTPKVKNVRAVRASVMRAVTVRATGK
jgi:hypothetical protein